MPQCSAGPHLSTLSGHQASSGAPAASAPAASLASLTNTWWSWGVTLPAAAASHLQRRGGSATGRALFGWCKHECEKAARFG